jgi:fatty-acyl-CoA synthase
MEQSRSFQMNILRRAMVGDMFERTAKRIPDETAFVFRKTRLTYKELNALTNRAAHALMEIGLKKGDTLAIMSHNCHQMAILLYACLKSGVRYSPLNFLLRGKEISYQVNHSDAKVMFVEDDLLSEVQKVIEDIPMVQRFGLINLKGVELPKGWINVDDLISEKYLETTPEVILNDEDIATIMYTSGTTAAPKGVALQQRSYIAMATSFVMYPWKDMQEVDVYLMNIPLYHVGATNLMIALLSIGGKIVATHIPDPMEILKLIQEEKVTYLVWPPTLYSALLQFPYDKYDLSSLKKLIWFGGAMPLDVFRKWKKICPQATMGSHLSQTECGTIGTSAWFKDEPLAGNVIGRVEPFLEIRLVDENGKEVPVGKPGEALFRSPGVMMGYYKDEKSTAETLKDGWLHTGDIFTKGHDGFYYYFDRKKDMIKTGGENVACIEVEETLNSHIDIEISAVFATPHHHWGEAVVAAVVPKRESLTEAEVAEFAKDKLAGHKIPKKIIMMKRTELPVSPTGKILKRVLREKYQSVFKDAKGK